MESPVIQAIILGVVQGLTEFLPVSSSGHLALCQQLIPGFSQPGLLLDVMLHVGTLAAVLVYFRKDIFEIIMYVPAFFKSPKEADKGTTRLLVGIVIASVPTAIIGLAIEDHVEVLFQSSAAVGLALIVTGIVLIVGDLLGKKAGNKPEDPGPLPSFLIGIVQGLAVIPGISRSGSTISAARALGIDGERAARFSFLVAIPAVSGATLITVLKHYSEMLNFTSSEAIAYMVGPLTAALVGYAAIEIVMRTIKGGKFIWFAVYCFVVGISAVLVSVIF